MATKGYHSYRGRRSGRSWLLVAVLVLLLAAACAYLFLQRYLRYTDDGGMYFALPFLEETAAEPDVQPESGEEEREMNLVIEEPEESEPAEEPYGDRRLLGLDAPPADAETLNALLAQAEANGFVCSLRDNAGLVYYASTAALRDAVASGAADAQTLSQLCQEMEALAVARLNCFHDSYYAWANMETAGLCQGSGYIWYDSLSYHWLDPAKEAARAYVISLAVECAQMGFDELLLEEMQYPASGNLEKISYAGGEAGRTESLVLFLTELRAALEPYGTKVSLLVDGRLLTAEGDLAYAETTGLDLTQLLPLVDAVYTETADLEAAQAALEALAGEGEAPALVSLTAAPAEGSDGGTEALPDAGNWYIP